jgi:guanylate kinase
MALNEEKIIVITAPSGAGKTSITKYLMQRFPQLAFSISATTRTPRGNETDGKDYYFIGLENFKQKIQHNEFIEWEMVYEGKYYGTLKSEITRIATESKIAVLDIDVKGAIHVKRQYPDSTLTIFIQPPSIEELKNRLQSRGSETPESLAARTNKASFELSFIHEFDKVIVNDVLENACREAEQIVQDFINL